MGTFLNSNSIQWTMNTKGFYLLFLWTRNKIVLLKINTFSKLFSSSSRIFLRLFFLSSSSISSSRFSNSSISSVVIPTSKHGWLSTYKIKHLIEAGVMHEAGYVDYLEYHFPFRYFTSVQYIIWEVLVAFQRKFLTIWGALIYLYIVCIYLFDFNNWVGWLCCVDRICNPVAIKLLVYGLLTWHIFYVFTSWKVLHLYFF